MFYSSRQKVILKIGSSEPYSTHPLLYCLHAEIIALNFITKKIQYKYSINDIYILIWKQNVNCEIKPAYCCAWCAKMLLKFHFPLKNIITISNEYMNINLHINSIRLIKNYSIQVAICKEHERVPLMKIKNCMNSLTIKK